MKKSLIRVLWICLCLALLLAAQPAQLVIVNHNAAAVTIQVWRYTGNHWDWITLAAVPPGRSIALSQVNRNDRFRALGPWSTPPIHVVSTPRDVWQL